MADKTDDLIISISTDLTTVKRQLRELGQSVTQSTSGVAKRFTDLGKQIDQSMTPIQKRINNMVGIPMPTGIKEWKGALADVAKETDLLTRGFKLNRQGLLELQAAGVNAFQALASGMSVARVAQMEGAQVIGAFAQGTEGGLKALVSSAVGLATKFPLATAAIAAAGVAVAAYAIAGGNDLKSLDEILKAHEANIKRLGDAYDKVAGKQQNYASLTARSVAALNDKDLQDAKNLLTAQIKDIFDSVYKTIGAGGGNQGPLQRVLKSQFEPFKQALDDLANTQDVKAFIDKIDSIAEVNPKLSTARDALKAMSLDAADTAANLPNLSKGVDMVADAVAQMNTALKDGSGFSQLSDEQQKFVQDLIEKLKDGQISANDFKAALNGLNGITPDFSGAISQVAGLADQLERAQRAALGLANTTPKQGRVGVNPFDEAQKQYDAAFSLASRIGIPGITPDSTKLPKTPRQPRPPIPRRTADDRFAEDIKSIQARTTALAQERGLIGATYEEQVKRNTAFDLEQKALKEVREEARKKGDQDWQNAKLTPERIAQIDAASEAYAQQAAALKKARDEMQEVSDASRDFAQTFIDDMISGKSAAEALGDALKQLGKRLEGLALDSIFGGGSSGSGLFGRLFGSFFGGGGGLSSTALASVMGGAGGLYADGGYTGAGGRNTVAGLVHKGEVVWSQADVARAGGVGMAEALRRGAVPVARGGGGSTTMHVTVAVTGVGDADLLAKTAAGATAAVHSALREYDGKLPGKVASLNKTPRRR